MKKDDHLIFENYVDGVTGTKQALGNHIMSIVKHGIPTKQEFIKIRQELHNMTNHIEARGTPATDEEKARAHEILAKIRNYRSQHPDDPGPYNQEENAETAEQRQERIARKWELNKKRWAKWKAENPEKAKLNAQRKAGIYGKKEENEEASELTAIQKLLMNELGKRGFKLTKISRAEEMDVYPTVFMKKQSGPTHTVVEINGYGKINDEHYKDYLKKLESEDAEDMSKSPFHYDPMHGLASAAHKIRDELRSAANDEARPEHIEKMAEIILGPQSEYASVDHYEKALSGVIELLNHYVVVSMN